MTRYTPLPEAMRRPRPATEATRRSQQSFKDQLDFSNKQSFIDARRGFIASLDPMTIAHDNQDRAAFDLSQMSFLEGEAPDTVNPSLWRQAQLNVGHHGLYEVVDGIYQVRSFDIANMTLIRGDTGWLIIDPLTSSETARAALALANQHLGARDIKAVIHTHSHADHFAGVLGVITQEEATSGAVAVIAPLNFVEEALSENVLAGNVMGRRATYMYGNLLKPSPTGFVTTGLGAALSMGSTGFILPNDTIRETGETRTIDGIELEFQMTMGSEAPSEMVFYFPQFKALCMSEITSHHLHNIYTPRGAQVRDAQAWANQINESMALFGDRLEVQFASHHWPIWGRDPAVKFLKKQRDLYQFIHDQTLRLANQGYTKEEIAEQLVLPVSLGKEFYNRDYYGTVYHNAQAVYVKYLGFFDGNPAHLHPLPPVAVAQRYIDFMGGPEAVLAKARVCYDEGDYRWVAEVLHHLVMTDPEHTAGRSLLADTLEQLGYRAESAPWRNFYLSGALELREGLAPGSPYKASAGMLAAIPLANFYQLMAVRLHAARAEGLVLHINLAFTDAPATLLSVENSVLHAVEGQQEPTADASLSIAVADFKSLMSGQTQAATLIEQGKLRLDGDAAALVTFAGLFEEFERRFPIVTPRNSYPEK